MERTLKGVVSMLCKKVDAASHTYESKSNLDGKLVVEAGEQRDTAWSTWTSAVTHVLCFLTKNTFVQTVLDLVLY